MPSERPKPRKPKVKKVKPKKKSIIQEELFCPFCQMPTIVDQKFCTSCGSNLKEEKEA